MVVQIFTLSPCKLLKRPLEVLEKSLNFIHTCLYEPWFMTLVFQRLSSLGYCFSASLPPVLPVGALRAFHRLSSLGYCSLYNISMGNNVYDAGISEAVWPRFLLFCITASSVSCWGSPGSSQTILA